MDQEPSVLDYVKARMRNWSRQVSDSNAEAQEIGTKEPEFLTESAELPTAVVSTESAPIDSPLRFSFPWRVLLVLILGLVAQLSLEPHQGSERSWQTGFFLYILASLILIGMNWRQEWVFQPWVMPEYGISDDTKFLRSSVAFIVSLVFALMAFWAFGGGQFNFLNFSLWLAAIVTMISAFWRPSDHRVNWGGRIRDFIFRPQWNISFNRSTLLFLAVVGLILFFRTYQLLDVPAEMTSDHAEKLYDVGDVLNGQRPIFFERNTGREFFQFYLTAAIISLFKTGLTYLSLKIGTVLAGLVAAFYIYLLGKEIGGMRVGLLVLAFVGIAYWPNIFSRYGLRFPLYPLFYAPALYYLVRGLNMRNRNYFLLTGLCLGLGLHGYSPFRIVPFVILLAIGLYLLHKQSEGYRLQTAWGLFVIVILALIVFLPLLRYLTEHPDIVLYRTMTRMGDWERPLSGEIWQIFWGNVRNSLTMFGWDDGEIWTISITHRPALDVVTAVFFHLGVVLLILRYIRQRHWFDLFTLISIPMLMMPSILSLAFPNENPALNRSAGAIVPVFLIVGLAMDGFLKALENVWNKRAVWAVGIFLLAWASLQNYDLVFNQYRKSYNGSSLNTTELGEVVHNFVELTGSVDTAWTVPYPYWVDTRLVMFNAGFPMRDNAIRPDSLQTTLADPHPKLFIINPNDLASMDTLQSIYPNGSLTKYTSKYPDKDFMIFLVPAR